MTPAHDEALSASRNGVQERRASPRVSCEIPVTALAVGPSATIIRGAVLRCASTDGVGVLAPREFAVGTVILIWREWRNPEHAIKATVIHNRREGPGWFHGCRRVDVPESHEPAG
jgi:hypothetical protein